MKNFFKSILVLAIIILFAQINLTAQNWEQMDGPYGGAVKQLTAHKNYLYALTYEQIYRSSDDGTTWKNVPTSQILTNANAISSQNGMLFLATTNEGILRSTDDGNTWQKQNNGLITDLNVNNIISNGTTLLAKTEKRILYRSTNDGINWNVCVYDSINTNQPLYSCNLMKTDGLNFYILANSPSSYSNVYSSSDNGNSWKKLLPEQPTQNTPALEIAKNFSIKDSVINFCGTSSIYPIVSTTDLGKTWLSRTNKLIYNNITCIINTGSTIVAGLNRYESSKEVGLGYSFVISKDNGTTWDTLNPQFRNIESLFQYKNYLFATTYGEEGILRSSDNGLNWEKSNSGLNAHNINSVSIKGNSKLVKVYRPVPGLSGYYSYNLYKSINNLNWGKYNDTIFPNTNLYNIGNDSMIVKSKTGIYLTDDFGKSWNLQSSRTFQEELSYSKNLFITMIYNDTSKHRYFELYYSTDYGKNWQLSSSTFERRISNLTYHNGEYYAFSFNTLIKSIDTGKTWQNINTPNGAGYLYSDSKYLYTYSIEKLYRLKLDNSDWDTLQTPSDKNSFYLSSNNYNLYCNTFLNNKAVLFKSTNNGDTWENTNIKLPVNSVSFLAFDNNKLYVGTNYSGIWTLDLANTDVENAVIKSQNELAVYPNPSQGKFIVERRNIEFSCNLPVKYSLKSITGLEVLSLISSDDKLEIKTDNFPSGIYYLTAEQNSSNVIQMITIAK